MGHRASVQVLLLVLHPVGFILLLLYGHSADL